MPQYDAYEDPLVLTPIHRLSEGHDSGSRAAPTTTEPVSIAQAGKPVVEPVVPVKNDGIYHIQPLHSAMSSHIHSRHSSLAHEENPAHLIPTTLTHPRSADPSPKTLNAEERSSLAAYTRAQAENDSIRLVLACERCGEDLNRKDQANDINEFAKEAHMLNGGWAHRSRASCELLSDRPATETWETRNMERLLALPRSAM